MSPAATFLRELIDETTTVFFSFLPAAFINCTEGNRTLMGGYQLGKIRAGVKSSTASAMSDEWRVEEEAGDEGAAGGAVQGGAGQGRAGRCRAGQGRAVQGGALKGRAGQGRSWPLPTASMSMKRPIECHSCSNCFSHPPLCDTRVRLLTKRRK